MSNIYTEALKECGNILTAIGMIALIVFVVTLPLLIFAIILELMKAYSYWFGLLFILEFYLIALFGVWFKGSDE